VSYILDALRKAERDRGLANVPTLATVHQPAPAPRRRLWPWIVGVVVIANAAALAWLMGGTRVPELSVRPARELSRSAPAPAPPPAPPAPDSRPDPDPVTVAGPPEAGPSQVEPSRPPDDVRPDGASRPPAAARAEADRRPAAGPAPVAEAPARPAVAPEASPKPAAPARPSPARVSRAARSASSAPVAEKAAAAPSAAAAAVLANLSLQAVVYSDDPRERIVFINNQKFVEGQSIDGAVTVERIMPDGVVLMSQGERITLRAEGAGRP
jgi:general secretion pathway protein B